MDASNISDSYLKNTICPTCEPLLKEQYEIQVSAQRVFLFRSVFRVYQKSCDSEIDMKKA